MKKTAVLTMVYNEPEFFPLWRRYYGGEVGEQNLFVIDHGTDDGSLDDRGDVNVIRIPRSPKDNVQRATAVTHQVAMLLSFYDHVVHVDVDEMLVADPRRHQGLAAFCSQPLPGPIVTTVGMNLVHLTTSEPDLNDTLPVLSQRRWAQFVSPMCKPHIVSTPVEFGSGFHGCSLPMTIGDIYCIHLRYFDRKMGLQRLARTRAQAWSSPSAGQHQRMEDEQWARMVDALSRLERGPELFTDTADALLHEHVSRTVETATVHNGIHGSNLTQQVRSRMLFAVPDGMASLF